MNPIIQPKLLSLINKLQVIIGYPSWPDQNPCHAYLILFPEPTVMSSVKNLYLIKNNISANPHTGEDHQYI